MKPNNISTLSILWHTQFRRIHYWKEQDALKVIIEDIALKRTYFDRITYPKENDKYVVPILDTKSHVFAQNLLHAIIRDIDYQKVKNN